MLIARALIVSSIVANAALAQERIEPLIARPVTLPAQSFDVTLHGAYINWATGLGGINVAAPSTISGEAVAFGVDFAATDRVQLGLATALPIHPGASFGSVLGSVAFAAGRTAAVRVDLGYERIGLNGDNTAGFNHVDRYFGGIGAPMKIPLSAGLAFVSGRTGAVQFGPFNNIGDSGTGVYYGATLLPEGTADFFVISGGSNDSGTDIGINLPLGLLLQPDPHFALTVTAGYSAAVLIPSSGSTEALHFIPVGIEAVVTPANVLDIGLRFFVDGYVGSSGSGSGIPAGQGYFDKRSLMLWFRFRAG